MHDAAIFALVLSELAPQTPPDHTVLVAVLSVVGIVGAALITGLLATRSPRPPRDSQLLSDQAKRLEALEAFLWRRRYDPGKIITGEERPEDVRA